MHTIQYKVVQDGKKFQMIKATCFVFQDFPYRGSLLLVMGDSVYVCICLSDSHALRISDSDSEPSKSEFWNILEHSTETVRIERFG